jgi:peptidoglycan/xylan/chitin deacetylase (PgdA/CDA1 family)
MPSGSPSTPSTPAVRGKERHILLCCDCEGTREQLHRLWQAIERVGVAANFFFVGDTAREEPELVREIARCHQVESHTMHHDNLRRLDKAAQRRTILDGRRSVEEVIGRPTRGFRAPYHAYNRQTVEILNEEGFVFDASRLYYFYPMGRVHEVKPTWFREWMPLYGQLGITPRAAFGFFRSLVRLRRVSVLPAHPHYSGLNDTLASAFEEFLRWAKDRGAIFWPIDKWLYATRGVALPEWVSPRGPAIADDPSSPSPAARPITFASRSRPT